MAPDASVTVPRIVPRTDWLYAETDAARPIESSKCTLRVTFPPRDEEVCRAAMRYLALDQLIHLTGLRHQIGAIIHRAWRLEEVNLRKCSGCYSRRGS